MDTMREERKKQNENHIISFLKKKKKKEACKINFVVLCQEKNLLANFSIY